VQSVGVVPVAVDSRHVASLRMRKLPINLNPVLPDDASNVLAEIRPMQRELRRRLGVRFVYLADEFYLLAAQSVPAANHYDGFPQYENGIGMVRVLKDGWARCRRKLIDRPLSGRRKITVVCGRLI
jgi:NifB/MoaA-like Fe-S oxidoreductase